MQQFFRNAMEHSRLADLLNLFERTFTDTRSIMLSGWIAHDRSGEFQVIDTYHSVGDAMEAAIDKGMDTIFISNLDGERIYTASAAYDVTYGTHLVALKVCYGRPVEDVTTTWYQIRLGDSDRVGAFEQYLPSRYADMVRD